MIDNIDVGGGTIKVAIAVLFFVYCGSWKSCVAWCLGLGLGHIALLQT